MNTTMKKIALIIAAAGFVTYAQAQKIAHIRFDSLVTMMPETKVAQDAAQNYLKGIEQELMTMQNEFETKYKEYLEKEMHMSELQKRNRQEDLQQLQKRIEDFRSQAQQDYQMKYAELTAPIITKAKQGIEAVAKEGNYKYVLDTSIETTNVLYSEPADDILNAVKKKLDTMPKAVIPGTGVPQGTGGIKAPPPSTPKK
ncbi:MAG: OmpH family outer membrane protein [Bacteroidetes bacterium]|nr:OmpH family outer membrane protein [Bacteroidota bacterium]